MDWTPPWERIRAEVLERDGYACRECGNGDATGDGLEVHHVRPRSADGPDEPANCVTLCEGCHRDRHAGRATYLDAEFVQTVRGYGPLTTGEVAEWLTCSRTTARRRLSALEAEGVVVSEDGTRWRPPRSVLGRIMAAANPFPRR